jgi:hypothetical protein
MGSTRRGGIRGERRKADRTAVCSLSSRLVHMGFDTT